LKLNDPIYIAGHTGLIGSALMRYFKANGFTNLITSTRLKLDLTDSLAVDRFFRTFRPKFVFLAAGHVGGIVENQTHPVDFINSNISIQLNVLQAAHRYNVSKLLFFGSSCMYPRECIQPMSESDLLSGKPEETSIAYAVSKLAGLQMCFAYNKQFGEQKFIPVIPNSAYGPFDNFDPSSGHVLSVLIRKFYEAKQKSMSYISLWGTGNPRREFIHADDIATASAFLMMYDENNLDLPLNIGVGIDYSIKELANYIANVVGYTGEIRWDASKPDGAPKKLLDSRRIKSLGWAPKISLEQGIKSTYKWFLENEL